jgi:hypothetical protein
MWYLQRTVVADMAADREISMDVEGLEAVLGSRKPGLASKLTPVESLMAAPGEIPSSTTEALFELKDAVIDCLEMLTERDQFIINAIVYERTGYKVLAERLDTSLSSAWRAYQDAIENLKQVMLMEDRITSRFNEDDDNG